MSIRYIDKESGMLLVDFDMILTEISSAGRSKLRRTIEKLKIKPQKEYGNRFLYKDSEIERIKKFFENQEKSKGFSSNWTLQSVIED